MKNSWQAQKILQRSSFIMWIVATLLEFQETELESQVTEGNIQVQNIIFHLYCICYLFLQPEGRKSSISKTLFCCAGDRAATASCQILPTVTQQCYWNWDLSSATGTGTQPPWLLSRWEGCWMFNALPQFSSSKKKRYFILGETVWLLLHWVDTK